MSSDVRVHNGSQPKRSFAPSDEALSERIVTDKDGHSFRLQSIVCPTCGPSPQRRLGLRGGRSHRHHKGVEVAIVECQSCGLLYPDPFPFPVNSQDLYADPTKYFAAHDETAKVEGYVELLRGIWKASEKGALLDVGSGRGELLRAAKIFGFKEMVGLELSSAMIEYCRREHGLNVLPKVVEDYAREANRTFDLVTLNAILEHVHNPDSFMAAVSKLTHRGSIVYLDLPCEPHLISRAGNALNRLIGNPSVYNLSPTWLPYHVFGFNPRSLGVLLKKHGFEIQRVENYATPKIPAGEQWVDRVKCLVGEQIMRFANLTKTASNMYVWARKT